MWFAYDISVLSFFYPPNAWIIRCLTSCRKIKKTTRHLRLRINTLTDLAFWATQHFFLVLWCVVYAFAGICLFTKSLRNAVEVFGGQEGNENFLAINFLYFILLNHLVGILWCGLQCFGPLVFCIGIGMELRNACSFTKNVFSPWNILKYFACLLETCLLYKA